MKLDPPSGSQAPSKLGGRGEGPSGLGHFPTLQGRPGFQPIELIEKLPWTEKEQAYTIGDWFTGGPTLGLQHGWTSATCRWKARHWAQRSGDWGRSPCRAQVRCNVPATSAGGRMPALQRRTLKQQGPVPGPTPRKWWATVTAPPGFSLQRVFPGFYSLMCHRAPQSQILTHITQMQCTLASEAGWRPSAWPRTRWRFHTKKAVLWPDGAELNIALLTFPSKCSHFCHVFHPNLLRI